MTTFALSIEEVAFAMGYLGGVETAAGFLTAITGKLPTDELTGRITAASHSLLARGLLILDSISARASLDPVLSQTIEPMLKGENSLRMSTTSNDIENTTTFFLDGVTPVRHRLIQEVVSQITLLDAIEAVATEIAETVCHAVPDEPIDSVSIGTVQVDALRQVRLKTATVPASELIALLQNHLPKTAVARMVSDMSDAKAMWGTVLRLEAGNDGAVEANKGFFTVVVSDHGWLFDMTHDPAQADVFSLSATSVRQATMRLLTSGAKA